MILYYVYSQSTGLGGPFEQHKAFCKMTSFPFLKIACCDVSGWIVEDDYSIQFFSVEAVEELGGASER